MGPVPAEPAEVVQEDSFEAWYASSYPRIHRAVAVSIGDPDLSDDTTAEAYARALERWERVRPMANRDGWVYRVAVNEARRRWRRRTRDRELPQPREHQADHEPPDPQLWAAVAALAPRQREAVALRYVAGLTEREVAAAMDISEGAASSTLAAARRQLERVLEGRER